MPEAEKERGREVTAEEYLAHIVYAYCATPADSSEESIAKALLEVAAARFGVDPNTLVKSVMMLEDGGRVRPPWPTSEVKPPMVVSESVESG
jgi:hypothetical protein